MHGLGGVEAWKEEAQHFKREKKCLLSFCSYHWWMQIPLWSCPLGFLSFSSSPPLHSSSSQHPEAQSRVRLESFGRRGDLCQCSSAKHHQDRGKGGTQGAEWERHCLLWLALVLALLEEQPYGRTSVVCYSLQRSRTVGHLREGSRKNYRMRLVWGDLGEGILVTVV